MFNCKIAKSSRQQGYFFRKWLKKNDKIQDSGDRDRDTVTGNLR